MHSCLYEFFRDQGSLIGGIFALLAGAALYVIGRVQVKATKEVADQQIAAAKETADNQLAALRSNLQADTMLRLMDKFDSGEFQEKLKDAAKACVAHLDIKDPRSRGRRCTGFLR